MANGTPCCCPFPPTPALPLSVQVLERAVAAAKMANGGKQPQLVLVLLPFKVGERHEAGAGAAAIQGERPGIVRPQLVLPPSKMRIELSSPHD